jgi:hypothetical protein
VSAGFTVYGRCERAIAAADVSTTRQRWEYGRRLICDPRATSPDGTLRPGVMDKLIAAAHARGVTIDEAEIDRRLAAGRAYPCESQIRRARREYESWAALCDAGFPPIDADLGDRPHDPRGATEKAAAVDRQLALGETDPAQLTLFDFFPDDRFDALSTLAELRKHAVDSAERTERHARKDRERHEYLDRLSEAVNGDESKSWAEAQAALDAA